MQQPTKIRAILVAGAALVARSARLEALGNHVCSSGGVSRRWNPSTSDVSSCTCSCTGTFMRRATAHANPSKVSLSAIHFANRSTVSSVCGNKVPRRGLSGSAQNAGPSTVSQGPLESMRTCVSRVTRSCSGCGSKANCANARQLDTARISRCSTVAGVVDVYTNQLPSSDASTLSVDRSSSTTSIRCRSGGSTGTGDRAGTEQCCRAARGLRVHRGPPGAQRSAEAAPGRRNCSRRAR